jgi:amino acid adenylation domain-containing protein
VAQEGIWLDEQLRPGTPMYNIPEAFRLRGRLDLAALQQSIAAIVRRHDALRTTLAWIDGRLAQKVAPPAPFILPVVNLDDLSESERTQAILRLSAKEARRPFDLAHGPLFRASLLRLADDDHVLFMTMHHLVSDAWSCAVIAKELETLYGAGGRDEVLSVDRPRIQFADVARWQRGRLERGELNAQRAYWQTQLRAGAEGLELIADYRHPHPPSARGGLHSTKLPSHLVEDLRAMCRREGITRFMALLASFALLLSRYARQDDIPVLVPVANRGRPELEDVVGCCFNMLVLRTDLSGNPRVRELLSRVRDVALGAYANQELPVVDLVAPGMGRRQWFRVLPAVFIFQNVPQSIPALSGLEVHRIDTDTGAAGTDICLDLIESPDGLTAKWKYNCDLFEDSTIARMATHFEVLLARMVIDPERRIHDLALLTETERDTLCRAWNGPERSVPEVGTVHGLFARQVETTPDAIAVIDGTERLSYRDLNRRSNQLAHHLRALGVGPGTRVGLYIRRSAAMVVGLVGILKTGTAYVPLGMSDPESRVHRVLEDAQISVLVSEDILGRGRVSFNGPIVRLDSDRNILDRTNASDFPSDVGPDDTAYIAYTSGSTGDPKGVVALHRGIVNRLAWIWDVFPFKKHEVCCQRTPLAFVDCVAEIFGPLLKGIPLVVLPDVLVQDPAWLTAKLAEYRVTRIVLVPSLLRMLLEHRPDLATRLPDLALWFTSGEPLDTELAERFHDRMRGRRLINLYGCSEASADSTYFEVAGSSGRARVPIGRPIWNTQTYVLDDALHPVPVGLPGELYVGGAGLARGYWRDPRLTAERFVPDVFGRQPGARLYRTGDLVRYGPGGNLEYLGRVDQQLKVRGIRIEPGEIESALNGHPAISRVAVAAHDNAPGDRRLIAYYVPRPSATVTPGDLREFLASRLPDAMVPSWFVSVPSLPLTASGKLDRLRLPAPDPEALAARAVLVTPQTDTEAIVGEVWREVLGLAQISVDDSFFELGGTSLLAARLVGRLASRVRRQIPVRAVFENETIAKLARYLDSGRTPFTERFRWADEREQFDL